MEIQRYVERERWRDGEVRGRRGREVEAWRGRTREKRREAERERGKHRKSAILRARKERKAEKHGE